MHLFNTASGLQRNHILLSIMHLLYLEYVTGDQYAHCTSMLQLENKKINVIFKETVFFERQH